MDKRKQSTKTTGGQRSNSAMPPRGRMPERDASRTPNRDKNNEDIDMRQARMDEQRELKEESSLPDDLDPVLDEEDLDENNISEDDADRVEWDPQSKRSGE